MTPVLQDSVAQMAQVNTPTQPRFLNLIIDCKRFEIEKVSKIVQTLYPWGPFVSRMTKLQNFPVVSLFPPRKLRFSLSVTYFLYGIARDAV